MKYIGSKEVTNEIMTDIEKKLSYVFPEDLRQDLIKYNRGGPERNLFLVNSVEKVFDRFFSLNTEDRINILSVNKSFTYADSYIVFANDPFGNEICISKANGEISFYDHENNRLTKVADNWSEFISMLHYQRMEILRIDEGLFELEEKLPITISLLRQIPGENRDDYWIGELDKTLLYNDSYINYVIVATYFTGTKMLIKENKKTISLAYVLDETVLNDDSLSFEKCKYVAIVTVKAI